ncbi:hypothetical protein BCV70DRAFT_204227 [Testicularia cyperi]|uniref:Uncharacterized protein n=1 Tax=Testicularia cyperi TaxID=1882483 RepID=A0A317Y1G1_9BASI|nr:hypothetical protein BCV70DRAFT_204227 [Testicularia cyperi]
MMNLIAWWRPRGLVTCIVLFGLLCMAAALSPPVDDPNQVLNNPAGGPRALRETGSGSVPRPRRPHVIVYRVPAIGKEGLKALVGSASRIEKGTIVSTALLRTSGTYVRHERAAASDAQFFYLGGLPEVQRPKLVFASFMIDGILNPLAAHLTKRPTSAQIVTMIWEYRPGQATPIAVGARLIQPTMPPEDFFFRVLRNHRHFLLSDLLQLRTDVPALSVLNQLHGLGRSPPVL